MVFQFVNVSFYSRKNKIKKLSHSHWIKWQNDVADEECVQMVTLIT